MAMLLDIAPPLRPDYDSIYSGLRNDIELLHYINWQAIRKVPTVLDQFFESLSANPVNDMTQHPLLKLMEATGDETSPRLIVTKEFDSPVVLTSHRGLSDPVYSLLIPVSHEALSVCNEILTLSPDQVWCVLDPDGQLEEVLNHRLGLMLEYMDTRSEVSLLIGAAGLSKADPFNLKIGQSVQSSAFSSL